MGPCGRSWSLVVATERQKAFCREYLLDLNATAAAVRAGYSPRTARAQACRLLKTVNIRQQIRRGMAKRAKRLQVAADDVVGELLKVAGSSVADLVAWDGDGLRVLDSDLVAPAALAGVREITETPNGLRLRLHDKLRALDLLGRHLGLLDGAGTGAGDPNSKAATLKTALRGMLELTGGAVGEAAYEANEAQD